jgi:hypothetical protein
MVRITVDPENPAPVWWEAARKAPGTILTFRVLAALIGKGETEVSEVEARAFELWAARLPGWADGNTSPGPGYAKYPIIFRGEAL